MDKQLNKIDFSQFSKVRDSLKNDLLAKYDQRTRQLSDDELDMVIAAGTTTISKSEDHQKQNN